MRERGMEGGQRDEGERDGGRREAWRGGRRMKG